MVFAENMNQVLLSVTEKNIVLVMADSMISKDVDLKID